MKHFKLTDFHCNIVAIIKQWTESSYDGIWNGYSQLFDELYDKGFRYEMVELKKAVKELHKHGFIKYEPTYNSDGVLGGKGYFYNMALNQINPTTNEEI